MYNLGDDSELDRLSREAAGRYDSPGNANWEALSEELDKLMPEEKKKRRFLFWWILPGLLAGGAITYGIIKRDGNNTASVEKNTPATVTDKTNEPSTNTAAIPTNKTATDQTDKKSETPIENPATVTASKSKENTTSLVSEGKAGTSIVSSKKARNTNGLNISKPAAKSTDKIETGSTPVQSSVITPETSKAAEQPLVVIKEQKEVTKENNLVDQPQTAVTTPAAKTEKDPVAETPAIKEDDKPTLQKSIFPARGKGWSFSLLTGVDKSTVKFRYGYKPGINLGLQIAYHFNDTWAVKTGAIYTQKNYKLAGEDFTAPKGSWVSYYKLDQVEGFCRMWEVPLQVSYTLSSNAKKAVTLNTGLSSYFMTREDYDYYYYLNSGSITSRNASYNSTDTHILSIAHLSAGFENRLSKTMSVEIEPYAKIPLGGVGFGNIKLSSFGINLSVQYRQPHKK